MADLIQVPYGAYREVVDEITSRIRERDVLGFLDAITPGTQDSQMVKLDLGIPDGQRMDHLSKIRRYRDNYEMGRREGVLHLSQLIRSIFEGEICEIRDSALEYLGLMRNVDGLTEKVNEKFNDVHTAGTVREEDGCPVCIYTSFRDGVSELVEVYKTKPFANFDVEDKKVLGKVKAKAKAFVRSRYTRNHPESAEFARTTRRLLELLEADSQNIFRNYAELLEKMEQNFDGFLERLEKLRANLGYRFDLTPQTKFIGKKEVLEFARTENMLLKALEAFDVHPRIVIMPCTTYLRRTRAQMYFDRNMVFQIRETAKENPGGEPEEVPETLIETDSITEGNVIYLSVTADVNRYLIVEGDAEKRRRKTWPRISCVLRSLGEFVYNNYFLAGKAHLLGLYDLHGKFEGPYREVAGELRPKPGSISHKILIHRQMLIDHGRQQETYEKYGHIPPMRWNEDTWRELISYFIGIYALGRRGNFPVEPERDPNPKSFYNTIYRCTYGFLNPV